MPVVEKAESAMKSEDALRHLWDRSMADTLVKAGSGLVLGALTSLVFFKRRPWPVTLGVGVGLGHGVANWQNDYRRLASSPSTTDAGTSTE